MTEQPIRIKDRKSFVNAAKNGFRVSTAGFFVQAIKNNLGVFRLGFTVTKKVGCAVVRNRVRRRLRETVRVCPRLPSLKGFDIVLIGRTKTLDRPFLKMQADLKYAFFEIKRFYNPKFHD